MTLPVEAEDVALEDSGDDLFFLQALEDCVKVLETGPVRPLTTEEGWEIGHRLACLLDSMLTSAAVDRRLRGES